MKKTSKCGLMIVAILSLCSCGKGTKTTEENFLERVNAIERNDEYTEADIVFYSSSSIKEAGKEKTEEDNRYTASFVKNEGQWIRDRRVYNDKKATEFFTDCVINSSPAQFVNEDINLFVYDRNDIKYYVDPYGVEYEYEHETNFFSLKYVSSFYMYYEWDQYGYITTVRTKSEEKNDTGEYHLLFTSNIKITYK